MDNGKAYNVRHGMIEANKGERMNIVKRERGIKLIFSIPIILLCHSILDPEKGAEYPTDRPTTV